MNQTIAAEPTAQHPCRLPRVATVALTVALTLTLTLTLMVALTLLSGCGGDEPSAGPPDIHYGIEECDYCRMIINQETFAAAAIDEAGTTTRFDDIGCLVDYLRQQRSARPPGESAGGGKTWVHDHAGSGWIAAEPAWFVRDSRGLTPMGSGLTAFALRPDAEAFASEHGWQVQGWPELLERASRQWPGSLAPDDDDAGPTPAAPPAPAE